MKLPYIRPLSEEDKIRRRELDEHMKNRLLSPCVDQTPEEIERYYRTEPEGSLAAVRHAQHHTLRYALTTIGDRRPGGRIGIEGAGDFYMKSGKNCFHPIGQTKLVVPTDAVKAWAEANPHGLSGVSTCRWEDRPFRSRE